MADLDLSKVGKISKGYEHTPKVIVPSDHFLYPSSVYQLAKPPASGLSIPVELILKRYLMSVQGKEVSPELVEGLDEFLRKEVQKEIIEKRMGIGFLILSQLGEKAFLNVQIFDNDDVLFPSLYVSGDATILGFLKKTTEDAGSSCIWEAKLISYEASLWESVLSGKIDKERYLNTFYCGVL